MLTLILSQNIWTGVGSDVDAILLEGASIVWTGKRQEFGEIGSDTKVVDLGNAFVCPGLIDTHVHLIETGINLRSCNLRGTKSITEIQERLSGFDAGDILLASGYDDSNLTEKRYLTAHDIDEAVNDRPAFIARLDGHSCTLNTLALENVGIPADTQGVVLDDDGNLTGLLGGEANLLARSAWHKFITDEEKLQGCIDTARMAHRHGATAVHALEGGWFCDESDVDLLLENRHKIPLDMTIYHQIMDVASVVAQGLPRIGGCVLLNGSFGSRSAALDVPYHDDVGRGTLYLKDEELHKMVWEASARGMQCAVHAIGERAIDQALRVYKEAAGEPACRSLRHRIEHFELPRPKHIEIAAKLGVILSMQPAFERLWGGAGNMYEMRLGEKRRKQTNPFRSILDAGITLGFGSDSDITPLNPILGMGAACTHPTEEQRVQPIEALRAYTMDAARLCHREEEVGVIQVGFRSDITVLGRSPMDVGIEEIEKLPVLMTMVGGRVEHWNHDVELEYEIGEMPEQLYWDETVG